jgi:hypothetical protein
MTDRLEFVTAWDGNRLQVTIGNGTIAFADRVDPCSARSRAALLKAAVEKFPALDSSDLERHLLAQIGKAREKAEMPADDPSKAGDVELQKTPDDIRAEARELLRSPDLIARVMHDIQQVGIVGEHGLALTLYLLGTSRLLPKPLAAIVQGSSSSGKSHVVDTIGALFPPESTLLATDLTANSLYYLPRGSLRHRFVVAGERSRVEDDARAEATRALREMLSSGVLRKVLPQKNGDVIETVVIENPGPIAFVESTTLADVFNEDANRALLLASDDGDEQTRAVVTAIAERYAGAACDDAERVRQRHRAAQRMLRRVKVQVPFALALGNRMPVDRPEARRAIHQVMAVVQAIALLHQFQRHDDPQNGSIVQATVADYRVARRLIAAPLARSLGAALPDHVVSFAEWLQKAVKPGETFTVGQLDGRAGCRWSRTTLYELVKPLHRVGVLADAGMNGRSAQHRLVGPLPEAAASWLPTAEELE